MNYLTSKLLNDDEIEFLNKNLDNNDKDWEDGKKTAGTQAAKLKNNLLEKHLQLIFLRE